MAYAMAYPEEGNPKGGRRKKNSTDTVRFSASRFFRPLQKVGALRLEPPNTVEGLPRQHRNDRDRPDDPPRPAPQRQHARVRPNGTEREDDDGRGRIAVALVVVIVVADQRL